MSTHNKISLTKADYDKNIPISVPLAAIPRKKDRGSTSVIGNSEDNQEITIKMRVDKEAVRIISST